MNNSLVQAFGRRTEFLGSPTSAVVLAQLRLILPRSVADPLLQIASSTPPKRVEVILPEDCRFDEESVYESDDEPGFMFGTPADWLEWSSGPQGGLALAKGFVCIGNDVYGGDDYWVASSNAADDLSLCRLYLPGIERPTWNAKGKEVTIVSTSLADLVPRLVLAREC